MLNPIKQPRHYFFDGVGRPLVGGRIEYVGTIYQDVFMTVPHKNPIVLDEKGSALMYFDDGVQLTLYDDRGQFIATQNLPARREQAFFYDKFGYPLRFGRVFTYHATTTQPKESYALADMSVIHDNPILLDGDGRASIYMNAPYRLRVYQANGVLVGDEDVLVGESNTPPNTDLPPPPNDDLVPSDDYSGFFVVNKSGNFTKNDCIDGRGTSVLFTKEYVGTSISTISQDEADRLAEQNANELALNFEAEGQAYANEHGGCIADKKDNIHEGAIVFSLTNFANTEWLAHWKEYVKTGVIHNSLYQLDRYIEDKGIYYFSHSISLKNYFNHIINHYKKIVQDEFIPKYKGYFQDENSDYMIKLKNNLLHTKLGGVKSVKKVFNDEVNVYFKGVTIAIDYEPVNYTHQVNSGTYYTGETYGGSLTDGSDYTIDDNWEQAVYRGTRNPDYMPQWNRKTLSEILDIFAQDVGKEMTDRKYFYHGKPLLKDTSYATGEVVRQREMTDNGLVDSKSLQQSLTVKINAIIGISPMRYVLEMHDGEQEEMTINFQDVALFGGGNNKTIHAEYVCNNFVGDNYYDIYPYGDEVIIHEKEE